MAEVKMTCNTCYNGKRLNSGDIVSVDNQTAARWELHGIATSETPAAPVEAPDKPLSKMTTAELEATAAELGVDLTDCTKNAERIAKIEEAQKGGGV